MSEWLPSLFKKSNHEQFPQVAHDKRTTGAICSFSPANRSFALWLTKNKRFARKTDEQIPNPAQQTSLIPCFDVTKALAQQISLLPQFDVTQELAQHTYFIPLVKVTQDWPNSRVGNLLFAHSFFALLLEIAQFKERP